MYWLLPPAVAPPAFSCPVSSIAPTARPPRRPPRRAASSRPAAANRRTWLIAANVSHTARLSSRWVRSGVRSPACSAIVHPFRLGSPLTSADTYLPACCHASVRTKHDRSALSSSARFRPASPAPDPGSSSRLRFCCPHQPHDREAAAVRERVVGAAGILPSYLRIRQPVPRNGGIPGGSSRGPGDGGEARHA